MLSLDLRKKHFFQSTLSSFSISSVRQQGNLSNNVLFDHILITSKPSASSCSTFFKACSCSCSCGSVFNSKDVQVSMHRKQSSKSSILHLELPTALKIRKQEMQQRRTSCFQITLSSGLENLMTKEIEHFMNREQLNLMVYK